MGILDFRFDAIRALYPTVTSVTGKDVRSEGKPVEIDETLVTEKAVELKALYDAELYLRDRAKAYKALNQDELRYDDMINGTNTWGKAIEDIKLKFPKPE